MKKTIMTFGLVGYVWVSGIAASSTIHQMATCIRPVAVLSHVCARRAKTRMCARCASMIADIVQLVAFIEESRESGFRSVYLPAWALADSVHFVLMLADQLNESKNSDHDQSRCKCLDNNCCAKISSVSSIGAVAAAVAHAACRYACTKVPADSASVSVKTRIESLASVFRAIELWCLSKNARGKVIAGAALAATLLAHCCTSENVVEK